VRGSGEEVLVAKRLVPLKTALYWWFPMAGTKRRVAVPAEVSCAVPRIAEFKQ
jgi:hypothetical protein